MAWSAPLRRLTVVGLALAFAGAFAFTIRDISGHAAMLPRGVIVAIVVVAVWNIVVELRTPQPSRRPASRETPPAETAVSEKSAAEDNTTKDKIAEDSAADHDTGTGETGPGTTQLWRGIGVVAATVGLVVLSPRIGFYPTAAIIAPVMMLMLGMRSLRWIALASGGLIGLTYVIFTLGLSIRLPG